MKRILLRTQTGEEVTAVLIPPFNPAPTVILWGTRIFAFDKDLGQYREAFAYCAFTEQEMKNLGLRPD